MGSMVQDVGASPCPERGFIWRRDWKRDAAERPVSKKMGRRQSQRRAPPDHHTTCSQESIQDRKQRRKHRCRSSSQQRTTPHPSSQGSSDCPPLAADDPMQSRTQLRRHGPREHKHTGSKGSRHTAAFPCHHPSSSTSNLSQRRSPKLERRGLSSHAQDNSSTDLSDTERAPPSPCSRVPPQLSLRPELIQDQDSFHGLRSRGQPGGGFHFPDFLPPPFNSWSLSQLAVFYNVEGHGAARPRPVGPLERYLERLLQLEWQQIQTVQEETGRSAASEVLSSCHRSPDSTSSRLSSPKCILQCQRAFPLSFLSCLAGHSALLSSCACTLCQIRYSSCSTSCCRSAHARHSRLSPMLGASRAVVSLPRRSYSESRVPPQDPERGSRSQRVNSPVRANSHLRRMQASGNMRNPIQGAPSRPPPTAREPRDELQGKHGGLPDCRTGGSRRRSGSEQRRSGLDRKQNGFEKRRSECRRAEGQLKDQEIKPDAVAAIKDNLPMFKYSPTLTPSRSKQVNFVT